jgi:hypothetical protein
MFGSRQISGDASILASDSSAHGLPTVGEKKIHRAARPGLGLAKILVVNHAAVDGHGRSNFFG